MCRGLRRDHTLPTTASPAAKRWYGDITYRRQASAPEGLNSPSLVSGSHSDASERMGGSESEGSSFRFALRCIGEDEGIELVSRNVQTRLREGASPIPGNGLFGWRQSSYQPLIYRLKRAQTLGRDRESEQRCAQASEMS